MSYATRFLAENRQRLGLAERGLRTELSSLLVTPQFRASAHAVALVYARGAQEPALVVKMARTRGSATLEREAAALGVAREQHRRPDSIPEVIALEQHDGHPLLVETALAGRPLSPRSIRHDHDGAVAAAVTWLTGFRAGIRTAPDERLHRLVVQPLRELASWYPPGSDVHLLAERALAILDDAGSEHIPTVVEHGDLSHPNLVWLPDGSLGVLDWELGRADGFPLHDLQLFIAYAAGAGARAVSPADHADAFRNALGTESSWGSLAMSRYSQQLELDPRLLPHLVVASWSRYVSSLAGRLGAFEGSSARAEPLLRWIADHRYLEIWRAAIEYAEQQRE